jgi:hypothetical protein
MVRELSVFVPCLVEIVVGFLWRPAYDHRGDRPTPHLTSQVHPEACL